MRIGNVFLYEKNNFHHTWIFHLLQDLSIMQQVILAKLKKLKCIPCTSVLYLVSKSIEGMDSIEVLNGFSQKKSESVR